MNEKNIDKLKDIFESIIDSDIKYSGLIKDIDYFSLFCKAHEKNNIHKILNFDTCMFNYTYKNTPSILMLFSINVDNKYGVKYISENVMELINILEKTFIKLEHVSTDEVKFDDHKFIYVSVIKNLE